MRKYGLIFSLVSSHAVFVRRDIIMCIIQYSTGIPVAIPVTAGIRGFAGIPVPAKFHFFAGIPYRDFTLNLVITTCQKIKIFQQKFHKKHVKLNTDFKLKFVIFFTQ